MLFSRFIQFGCLYPHNLRYLHLSFRIPLGKEDDQIRVVESVLTDRFKPVFFTILKNRKPVIFSYKDRFFKALKSHFIANTSHKKTPNFLNIGNLFFNFHLKTQKTFIKSGIFGFCKTDGFRLKIFTTMKNMLFLKKYFINRKIFAWKVQNYQITTFLGLFWTKFIVS